MTYWPSPWPEDLKRICADEREACGGTRVRCEVDEDTERLPPGAITGQVCRECWIKWTNGTGRAPDHTKGRAMPRRDMTDADLRAAGWRWALRGPDGELLAVTNEAADVSEWDLRYNLYYSIRILSRAKENK